MYLRAAHAELDVVALREFIRENPLGILITGLQSSNFPTLQCTHLPWILDIENAESETELGVLRGHIARANPHAKALTEAAQQIGPSNGALEDEVTILFNGPVHSYVSPKFYVATKPDTGKVVPTWNYSAAQVYGKAKILWDPKSDATGAFLEKQINDLTKTSEESVMDYAPESVWKVSDAPVPYVELLKKNIMGIEIDILRLEGKHKMSQELGYGDREGVIQGFKSRETEHGLTMARSVEERGAIKDKQSAKTV